MARQFIFLKAFFSVLLAGPAVAQSDEAADWSMTRNLGTSDAYFLYLQRYPRGTYVEEAIDFLQSRNALRDGEASRVRSIKLY